MASSPRNTAARAWRGFEIEGRQATARVEFPDVVARMHRARQAVDALRRILRGPNPEGRGLAAVGLSSLDALSPQDLRVIARLEQTPAVSITSGGCMVSIESAPIKVMFVPTQPQ